MEGRGKKKSEEKKETRAPHQKYCGYEPDIFAFQKHHQIYNTHNIFKFIILTAISKRPKCMKNKRRERRGGRSSP